MRQYVANLEVTQQIAGRVVRQSNQPFPVRLAARPRITAETTQRDALGKVLPGMTGRQLGGSL